MAEVTWEPPGKGPWELEATHFSRPVTRFVQSPFCTGFVRGFSEGTARYGLLLDHIKPAVVNGFMYTQPVAFGAPEGAMGPPPKLVLSLLTRLHPKMRGRIRTGAQAFAKRQWRADLTEWDQVDRPAAVAKHRAIQAVDVASLSDSELSAYVQRCGAHLADMHYLHHKYTATAVVVTGDLLAAAVAWTGAPAGEVLDLLRGTSQISRGFAADELDVAGKVIASNDSARLLIHSQSAATETLARLSEHPIVGADVRAYLEAVRDRSLGYDVSDPAAGEMPEMLLEALRTSVEGTSASPIEGERISKIRSRVPSAHLDDFDKRLGEAQLVNRLRDERGVFSDGWATGLARRALLEAGRRLARAGKLAAPEHAVDLDAAECAALLRDESGPSSAEVAERVQWRTSHTTDDAPPFLRAMPAPLPSPEALPPAARRPARAVDAVLSNLFGVPDTANSDVVLHGLAVNPGIYEGPARLVHDPADFGKIKNGDVLVTRMTSPYFNVVLPMLGALVTDRGGQLSHAAIVAREYGIPAIVGTREATAKIVDGDRVRVDGSTGELRLLR